MQTVLAGFQLSADLFVHSESKLPTLTTGFELYSLELHCKAISTDSLLQTLDFKV